MAGLSMFESTVSLSYGERLKAELVVALGRIINVLWLCFFPACGAFLLSLRSGWLDTLMAAFCIGFVPGAFILSAWRGQKAAAKNGPFVYRLSPDGFELKTRTADLRQSWPGIPRVRVSSGFLLVYANKRCAYPVPLRLLSHDQVQAALAWAEAGGVERVGA